MISGKIKILYAIDLCLNYPSGYSAVSDSTRVIPHIEVEYETNLVEGIPVLKSQTGVKYTRISSKEELSVADQNAEFFHSISMVLKYLKTHSFKKRNGIGKSISDKKYSFNIRPKSLYTALTDDHVQSYFRWSKNVKATPIAITCSSPEIEQACKSMNMQYMVTNSAYETTINQLLN